MITVFGLGFVGLTTALGFAHYGFRVYGVDVDENRKETIRNGKLPFLEPGLDTVLREELNQRFFIADNAAGAVAESDIIYYCVGTPYGEDGEADLTYLFCAIEQTLPYIRKDKKTVLVTKSTIPPSTTKEKIIPFVESRGYEVGKTIFVANNPEFLREGHCWEDFIQADRIVIGSDYSEAADMIAGLYEPFGIPVYTVSSNTGEFIKYLSNTLLATMISYSNEMAEIADTIGEIETAEAFHILHMDKRWNHCSMSSYVYPGCGYGGYCLPKDTNALYAAARKKGADPKILGDVIATNDAMPKTIAERIQRHVQKDKRIGILGLSFKPGSDDVRDAAPAKIIRQLRDAQYENMIAYDPVAMQEFEKHYPDLCLEYAQSLGEIAKSADVLVVLTAWEEFQNAAEVTGKEVLDYRYMN